jgi:hypothetical protein
MLFHSERDGPECGVVLVSIVLISRLEPCRQMKLPAAMAQRPYEAARIRVRSDRDADQDVTAIMGNAVLSAQVPV